MCRRSHQAGAVIDITLFAYVGGLTSLMEGGPLQTKPNQASLVDVRANERQQE